MDLIVIVGGMTLGGGVVCLVLQAVPGLTLEQRVLESAVGALIGAVAGYGLVWKWKGSYAPTTAAPPRHFKKQVVGSDCATCGRHMMMAGDGAICEGCDTVYCAECEPYVPCLACRQRDAVVAEVVDD